MKRNIIVCVLALVAIVVCVGSATLTYAQTLTVLHTFADSPDGGIPLVGLVPDSDGNLYGTTIAGGSFDLGTVYKLTPTHKETVLYSFKGGTDGANPYAGSLVRDSNGNLYGTTEVGGAWGWGTVFRVSATGQETLLYSFSRDLDGGLPYGGLTRDSAGNLYGTTYFGGVSDNGTIFKLDTTGKETVLHSFGGPPSDGQYSYASLFRDPRGNLYGTNYQGGAHGQGTVFKVDPQGHEAVLYNFKGMPDGQLPYSGVVTDGKALYGTTIQGGTAGVGAVFKLDRTGETILYSFSGNADGGLPLGGLVMDSVGNLYGTTCIGGAYGQGAVFKLDGTGKETVLYSFTGGADGKNPNFVVLLRDKSGNLYGTTSAGAGTGCGGQGCGTIFKLAP